MIQSIFQFKNQELINEDGNLFLTVDSLIRINNIITNSHNLYLRRHNVKPAGYNKQSMDVNRIEMVEHAKFYSMTRLKISIKFMRRLVFDLIYLLFRFVSGPLQNFVSRNVIFSKLCSVFINMIKEEYVFMLYALFIDQVSCIINSANILTNGRWRCQNEMGQRICYRYSKL